MTAYYNENDLYAAEWLRNLIAEGLLPAGVVDDRSITDVEPKDLEGFQQCHFFCGIGIWPLVLRQCAFPDDRVVWTGSAPCQPFSSAGQQQGFDDKRHLWPVWFRLIRECRPDVVLGEQVSSKRGLAWWDVVADDLESEGYAAAAVDSCAAGAGAPHLRQRLYWVGNADGFAGERPRGAGDVHAPARRVGRKAQQQWMWGAPDDSGQDGHGGVADAGVQRRDGVAVQHQSGQENPEAAGGGSAGGVADAVREGQQGPRPAEQAGSTIAGVGGIDGQLADAAGEQLEGHAGAGEGAGAAGTASATEPAGHCSVGVCGPHWGPVDWVWCIDGKWRPTQPGTFPLAPRNSNRVAVLHAIGNALCAPQAKVFAETVKEILT